MVVVALILLHPLVPKPESTVGPAEWMQAAVLDVMVHCILPMDLLVVQTMDRPVRGQLQEPKSTALQPPSVEDWAMSVLA